MNDQLKPIGVGVIGLGVGESHLRKYLSNSRCKVIGICDENEEVLSIAKEKYPGVKCYLKADQLLEEQNIEAVSIASYDHSHYEQIIKGIRNRKHLLVEKPIVIKPEHLIDVRKELELQSGLIFTSNLVLRKTERFLDLKNRLQNNEFGKISYINASYNYGRFAKLTDGWRRDIRDYSVVLGGGIHLIDLILWLTGDRVSNVFAIGNNIHGMDTSFQYNDLVTTIMEMESGCIVNLTCNFGNVSPHFHQFDLYGTKQTFINGDDYATIYTQRDVKNGNFMYIKNDPEFPTYKGAEKLKTTYKNPDKGSFIDDFINAIEGNSNSAVQIDEIYQAMTVAFAIDESRQKRKEIKLTQKTDHK